MERNELEVSSPEVALSAARDFAAALAETRQFKAFERANETLKHDTAAQEALALYQAKAGSLRAMLMLNAVEEAERAELERLKQDYLSHASVQALNDAEAGLTELCQEAAGRITAAVGLNYSATCGASCCG
jgi:cell fate (sporulation/competence/biofilm development) regulator YlbF (YheA/YmcA/DUF963 family)